MDTSEPRRDNRSIDEDMPPEVGRVIARELEMMRAGSPEDEKSAEQLKETVLKMRQNFKRLSNTVEIDRYESKHEGDPRSTYFAESNDQKLAQAKRLGQEVSASRGPIADEETGLEVVPKLLNPYRASDRTPESISVRFAVTPKEGESRLEAHVRWATEHLSEAAADQLATTDAAERATHYFTGSTGPIRIEVSHQNRGSRDDRAWLAIGPVHYSHYNGPNEDRGIRGPMLPLTLEMANMLEGAVERATHTLIEPETVDLSSYVK